MKSLSIQVFLVYLLFVLNVYTKSIYHENESLNKRNFIQSLTNKDVTAEGASGVAKNIDYGTTRKLDIYYHEDSTELKPVAIYIFGGAWFFSSKDNNAYVGQTLKEAGYVSVLPDYVLYPHGKVEDMVNDVYSAIMWTYNNIEKYGGDPNNITISGHSSGAHLTLLTIIKSALGLENLGVKLEPLPFIKKAVLINGPYNFDDYSVVKQLFNHDLDNSLAEKVVRALFSSKNISPTDIIRQYGEEHGAQSLSADIFPKFVFVYSSLDIIVPPSSVNDFMAVFKNVVKDPIMDYQFFNGMTHNTLTSGVKLNDQKYKDIFIKIVKTFDNDN